MIDQEGFDRLLLRNPPNYKAGFWATFVHDGQPHVICSNEPTNKMKIVQESGQGRTRILARFQDKGYDPFIELEDILWSWNSPFLLWGHTLRNTTEQVINDLRLYLLMDYDLNGPKSYNDDMGRYEPETGEMTVWDEKNLYVKISSRPIPDMWDISSPVKLKVDEANRDLNGTLEMGPQDIVIGLQWNIGDVQPKASAKVDITIASAESLEEVSDLTHKAWDLYDKKMQ